MFMAVLHIFCGMLVLGVGCWVKSEPYKYNYYMAAWSSIIAGYTTLHEYLCQDRGLYRDPEGQSGEPTAHGVRCLTQLTCISCRKSRPTKSFCGHCLLGQFSVCSAHAWQQSYGGKISIHLHNYCSPSNVRGKLKWFSPGCYYMLELCSIIAMP